MSKLKIKDDELAVEMNSLIEEQQAISKFKEIDSRGPTHSSLNNSYPKKLLFGSGNIIDKSEKFYSKYPSVKAPEWLARFEEKWEERTMKYKGDIEGWPEEVVNKMMYRQEQQGNPRDVTVFEEDRWAGYKEGGIYWDETPEGDSFWDKVVGDENFDHFFERYPKHQQIEPVDSHPFATYELVNYDSPEGTCLVQGSFAKCKEEMKPGNILRRLDKSSFIRYNERKISEMRNRAQTSNIEELRSMVNQCLDALVE